MARESRLWNERLGVLLFVSPRWAASAILVSGQLWGEMSFDGSDGWSIQLTSHSCPDTKMALAAQRGDTVW
jgi:hypothetical protein